MVKMLGAIPKRLEDRDGWKKIAVANFLPKTFAPKAMVVQIVEAEGGRVGRDPLWLRS